MPTEKSVLQLRQQIKNWEHEFQKSNNRLPTKLDIKADVKIHKLYKTYRYVKDVMKEPKQSETKEQSPFINVSLDEPATDEESDGGMGNLTELGPTPQANGKVLSILDLRMTPPNSSPLKRKLTNLLPDQNIFKTPTKRQSGLISPTKTPLGKLSLAEKLMSIADKTPSRTPKNMVAETPNYLGKITKKFEFDPSQTSPIKFKIPVSPVKLQTPTKPASSINFLVSPSPLKLHRFLNKKLSEVFSDFQAIKNQTIDYDDADEQENQENEDNIEENEQDGKLATPIRKRQKTQKRTTRRWKIKPRNNITDEEDNLATKDIHREMAKLNEKNFHELSTLVESDKEDANSSESDDEFHRPDQTDTKGKIKPFSSNYQRLKINDPRTKRFKNRFRR